MQTTSLMQTLKRSRNKGHFPSKSFCHIVSEWEGATVIWDRSHSTIMGTLSFHILNPEPPSHHKQLHDLMGKTTVCKNKIQINSLAQYLFYVNR